MAENISSSELITPESIKKKVLSFFDSIDLKTHTGETDVDHLKIVTKPFKALPWTSEVDHHASINGFEVAKYMHQGNDILSPLEPGKVRDTNRYILNGYVPGRGEITARYEEFDGKPAKLTISTPGTANSQGKSGSVGDFETHELNQVIEVLGLKL